MDFFSKINFNDLFRDFFGYIGFRDPLSIFKAIVDIGIVTYVVYKVVMLVRDTRAWQLIKGIVFLLIVSQLSSILGLRTISYILNNTFSIIAFALVVLFQPELRRGLEQIGRSRIKNFFNIDEENTRIRVTTVIEEIVNACMEMSKNYTGALIVIEGDTKIGDVINTGIELDSGISSELLMNIFIPNAPLHDGAVVIRENRIKAAACFLPLTDNPNLSKELGTRHRAALGITEVSDSMAIVVSEESGRISFALNGGLTRNLTADTLRKALNRNMLDKAFPARKKLVLWKVKSK